VLELLDLEKVRRIGAKRFLFFFALGLSALFLGVFVAVGVAIDGQYAVHRELVLVSLAYGFVMTAIFGRRIWRLSSVQG